MHTISQIHLLNKQKGKVMNIKEIEKELGELEDIIQGTEISLDYSNPFLSERCQVSDEEYERYKKAVERRAFLTAELEKIPKGVHYEDEKNFKTDKKKNMAYWDEIDDIILRAVKDIIAWSTSEKKLTEENEEEDDILNISKEALDIIIPRLRSVGYEFPFVEEETAKANVIKFIFPLFPAMHAYNGYWYDITSDMLPEYQELLENEMLGCQGVITCGGGMEQLFDENTDVKSKLKSIIWGFEEFGGKLYGVVTVELTDSIDEKGIEDLKEWISGQNSDGLGEILEEKVFDVDGGRLSISLWEYDRYFIYTEEEFRMFQKEGKI